MIEFKLRVWDGSTKVGSTFIETACVYPESPAIGDLITQTNDAGEDLDASFVTSREWENGKLIINANEGEILEKWGIQ